MPRSKEKYPALNVARQVAVRREQLDMDYIDQLSDKDKAWLNAFCEEEIIANFKHKGKKFNKTKKAKRALYRKNNARNRDIYGQAKVSNRLDFSGILSASSNAPAKLNSILDKASNETASNVEDAMLTAIDIKREGIDPFNLED